MNITHKQIQHILRERHTYLEDCIRIQRVYLNDLARLQDMCGIPTCITTVHNLKIWSLEVGRARALYKSAIVAAENLLHRKHRPL